VLRRRAIRPFSGGAGAAFGADEAHIERASRIALDIAGEPVFADAASMRQIVFAYVFGDARQLAREICCIVLHASLPSLTRSTL